MTAVFGTLVSTTDEEIAVNGFPTDLAAGAFELHEVVDGVMRESPTDSRSHQVASTSWPPVVTT